MIYLLAKKSRGAIVIDSMRYFVSIESLESHLRQEKPAYWWGWNVYRVYGDERTAKVIFAKEARTIGLA
jgi:hypothetical protein